MSSEALGTVTGGAEADQGLVPKLRFPEFRDARGWKERPLASLAHINPPNSGLPASFAYIDLGVVEDGSLTAINVIERDGAPSRAQRVLQSGDVLFQMVRPYQRNNLLFDREDTDFVASTGYAQLRSKGSAQFLYQIIHTDYFVGRVIGKCTGSNYPAINSSDLAAISVVVPEDAEQQKIADCLSSLDEVIAAEGDRLAALRGYKKGLMQQLFPRPERIENGEKIPAETIPRLRFPEFQNAGEWEERSLAQISPAIFDGTHQTPTYVEEGVPFYSVENLVSGNKNKFISQIDHELATAKNKPEIGDVLLTRIGKIGFSRLIDWPSEFSIYVTLAVVKQSPEFNSGYLNSYFQSDRYQIEIHQRSLLNAVPCKINMDELRRSRVLLPTLPEQERIADCLRYCDAFLNAQVDKIAALKAHKLGLMQQLFSSPAEASA